MNGAQSVSDMRSKIAALTEGRVRVRARPHPGRGYYPPPSDIDDTDHDRAALCRIRTASQSAVTTQITWPVFTGWPGWTDSSLTRPARGVCTSFSIFIASTMQIT